MSTPSNSCVPETTQEEQRQRVAALLDRMDAADLRRQMANTASWTLRDVAQWMAQQSAAGESYSLPPQFELEPEDLDWVNRYASNILRGTCG